MQLDFDINLIKDYFKNEDINEAVFNKIENYVDIFLEYADKINLISTADKKKIYSRHILDALQAYHILKENEQFTLIDMGSGSGIPVIPNAIFFENSEFTAVEPREKRASYLSIVKRRLNLKNLCIINDRIENISFDKKFDYISCRALSDFSTDYKRAQKLSHLGSKFITFKSSIDDLPKESNVIEYNLPSENKPFYLVSMESYD